MGHSNAYHHKIKLEAKLEKPYFHKKKEAVKA